MKGIVTTPEGVIYGYIINESLGDIGKIRSLESSIQSINNNFTQHQNTSFVDDKENAKEDVFNGDEDDWDDIMGTPEFNELMSANREYDKEELDLLKKQGSHPDGLQPILILLGDISMIRREVIEPAKEIILNDEHYRYDIEFREIDSSQITKEFVNTLPKPNGKDGGILVVKNISKYIEMYDVTDRNGYVRRIMASPIGAATTGWRIIFLEEADSEDVPLMNSFVEYWTKGNLYLLFVAKNK